MSYTSPLAASSLFINHPNFLHAKGEFLESEEAVSLTVYRSLMVRTTDPMFEPVADVLNAYEHEVLIEETVKDSNMMFGKAIMTLYKISLTTKTEEYDYRHIRTSTQERVSI